MNNITILLDYKDRFETKYTAVPYRSGMSKILLKKYFKESGLDVDFIHFPEVDFRNPSIINNIYLYSSSEDPGSYYKQYIEDIIFGLELTGAIVIPGFKYLRAHHNKVFMEIIRDISECPEIKTLKTIYYGCLEELAFNHNQLAGQEMVIKPAEGAKSRGIHRAGSLEKIEKKARKISRTKNFWNEIKDIVRPYLHKGYTPDSKYRKKYIVQNFVNGLGGDWKVLIYGLKYYILERENRRNDFRASGSGLFSYPENVNSALLDYAEKLLNYFNVPNISFDIGFDGEKFHLFEFQFLYFGTTTIENSRFFFTRNANEWQLIEAESELEKVYAESVSGFISKYYGDSR